jgi:hypothetical protein
MGVIDVSADQGSRDILLEPQAPRGFRETVLAVAARAKAALPEAAERIDSAAALVLAGEVELLEGGRTARVGSRTDSDPTYLVDGQCQCPEVPTAPGHFCMHRLAYGIAKRATAFVHPRQVSVPTPAAPAAGEPPDAPDGAAGAAAPGERPALGHPPAPNVGAPLAEGREIPAQYLQLIDGKPFVKYAGLLAMAHAQGLQQLAARFRRVSETLAVAQATATFTDGRCFTESGDATPENVGPQVRPHFARLALTRAMARCVRDALNIGLCAVEELGG